MRRVLLLGLLPLLSAGCGDDHTERAYASCRDGVEIRMPDFDGRFAADLPVSLRACFDADCDEVKIVRDPRDQRRLACDWDPGGPTTQLTSCETFADGLVRVTIARVDGRSYADGASHTVAVSLLRADGSLAYAHAEATRLPEVIDADTGVCHIDRLTFR